MSRSAMKTVSFLVFTFMSCTFLFQKWKTCERVGFPVPLLIWEGYICVLCRLRGRCGDIGNRILHPCLAFLWSSMFLLWLFCVINSGCINPEAPRNVYQYTEQIQSRFRIFNLNNTYSFWNLQKEGWYLGLPNQMKALFSRQEMKVSWILIGWTYFIFSL